MLKYSRWLVNIFLICFLPTALASTVIHRAVEPAQVMLDITQNNHQLTLYLSIPVWLTAGTPLHALTERADEHWNINEQARCVLRNKRLFTHEENTKNVQVVYGFECQAPQLLQHIEPQLQSLLPALKQINAWVSTEHLQNKQVVNVPPHIIYLTVGL